MMKTPNWLMVAVALAGAVASGPAPADHVHWHLGVNVGPGYGYGYYPGQWGYPYYGYSPSYYPYYAYPPVVTTPPVYIERGDSPAATENWWNYCPESKSYYPYVRECPGGWERVSPVPPDLKGRGQ